MELDDGGERGWEYSVKDYVRLEQESELVKHEFDDGQIRAMSGGTLEHARLAIALAFQIQRQLGERPCAVYSSDSRIRIAGLITYPDITVGCGPVRMDTEDRLAQLNPCVIAEVTSRSSERYDRGKKRVRYQQIPSLRAYVIVSHREHAIDVFSRATDGPWSGPVRSRADGSARIDAIGCEIDVDELYADPRATPRSS